MNKAKISLVVALILIAGIMGYMIGNQSKPLVGGTNNAVGTTQSSAKIASVVMSPATSDAISTSILNTDGDDRIITSSYAFCTTVGTSKTYLTGTGLAALKFRMATSSTATQNGNSNYASDLNVSTSTNSTYQASSTEPLLSVSRVWDSGSYLTFTSNATNTATCVVGVNYLSF